MVTKIIRFDENGFKVKPYASTKDAYGDNAYYYTGTFIDYEIDESWLEKSNVVLNDSKEILTEPQTNDTKWNGCFVFIETFNSKEILETLFFKSDAPMFCGEITDDEMIVWAKNWNYRREILIRELRYFKVYSEGTFNNSEYFYGDTAWVKMTLNTFKKRMKLAATHFSCSINELPEELLECYFLEHQVNELQNIQTSRFDHVGEKSVKETKLISYIKKMLRL